MKKEQSKTGKSSGCWVQRFVRPHGQSQNTIHWNTDDGSVHIYPGTDLKYALIEKRYIPILIEYLQKHLQGEPVFQV